MFAQGFTGQGLPDCSGTSLKACARGVAKYSEKRELLLKFVLQLTAPAILSTNC